MREQRRSQFREHPGGEERRAGNFEGPQHAKTLPVVAGAAQPPSRNSGLRRALRATSFVKLVDEGRPAPEPTGPRRQLATTQADMESWAEDYDRDRERD
jgi:hypothetical protein